MAIHWAKLLYTSCYSEQIVSYLLIASSSIGIISTLCLHCLRLWKIRNMNKTKNTCIPFLKVKLISMYVFGLGYVFHCVLYAWKHSFEEDFCPENSNLGLAYNVLSIVYTFCLFIYFALFYKRKDRNTLFENVCSLGIVLANMCIWLDAIFSESSFLFKNRNDFDNSTTLKNVTSSSNRAVEVIEKTDSFLSPALIEFSLMAIDMLFAVDSDSDNNLLPDHFRANVSNDDKNNCVCTFFRVCSCLIILTLFTFTITIVLTTDTSADLVDYPGDFFVYVCFQFIMKLIMFILILTCLVVKCSSLTFNLNVSVFVLLVSCFGNVVYHTLYCFALDSEGRKPQSSFLILSWLDNIASLLLALGQTMFIIGTHLLSDCEYQACYLLGLFNLGLWASDSIGEERLPVFSITIFKAFEEIVWSIINKIILPLTIFYRFHTGLDFLEMYWKHAYSMDN